MGVIVAVEVGVADGSTVSVKVGVEVAVVLCNMGVTVARSSMGVVVTPIKSDDASLQACNSIPRIQTMANPLLTPAVYHNKPVTTSKLNVCE
jgi:hypothetical protein